MSEPSVLLEARVADIPLPHPSLLTRPYWDGCTRGELRYQRCPDCGAIPPTPVPRCLRCSSGELDWVVSRGRGRLYSWTVVWRPQHPAFDVPYAPAIVRLDEGPFLLSAVVGCRPEDLCEDLALSVEFVEAGDGVVLPFFHPA